MRKFFFKTFRSKVTFIFILLMILAGLASNYLIYEYSLRAQLDELRKTLAVLAHSIAIHIDAETLLKIPLNKEGKNTPHFRIIKEELERARALSSSIAYIYIMRKTEEEGILKFVIDVESTRAGTVRPTADPGEKYNAARFPELMNAFIGPTADKRVVQDEWGVFLSGYSPIYDTNGGAVAILGIDMHARDVYNIQNAVRVRIAAAMVFGIIVSILLGTFISARISRPIKELVKGTRHIASGDLHYQVKIKGEDEISELAAAFNQMARNLYRARRRFLGYFYRMVQSLIRALEARDSYTRGHSDRVAEYSEKIALAMELPKDRVELLRDAALLHDIGKIGMTENILNKKEGLAADERKAIEKHPAIGEDILKPLLTEKDILDVVRSHHERYDGKGYPDRLPGDKINALASIVAVADAYDAMTSNRVYKRNLGKDEAIKELEVNKGLQFDPRVVDVFIRILREEQGKAH